MKRRAGWMLIGLVVGWTGVAQGEKALEVVGGPSGLINVGAEGGSIAPNGAAYQAYGVVGWASCNGDGIYCTRYAVYAGGDLAYTGSLLGPGDLSLKGSLAPADQALPKLLALEVVSYEHVRNEEFAHMNLPEGQQVGFVAQQVAEVLPELVVEAVHPPARDPLDRSRDADPIRYLALKQVELIPYLVKALQEQQAEIEALKADQRRWRSRLSGAGPAEEGI